MYMNYIGYNLSYCIHVDIAIATWDILLQHKNMMLVATSPFSHYGAPIQPTGSEGTVAVWPSRSPLNNIHNHLFMHIILFQ